MSFAFPAKRPELHSLIFLTSSPASLSSIISKTWLLWFVIILPYPLGLSVSNPRIEILQPSSIFLIILLFSWKWSLSRNFWAPKAILKDKHCSHGFYHVRKILPDWYKVLIFQLLTLSRIKKNAKFRPVSNVYPSQNIWKT